MFYNVSQNKSQLLEVLNHFCVKTLLLLAPIFLFLQGSIDVFPYRFSLQVVSFVQGFYQVLLVQSFDQRSRAIYL
jgi:hypothetical protein